MADPVHAEAEQQRQEGRLRVRLARAETVRRMRASDAWDVLHHWMASTVALLVPEGEPVRLESIAGETAILFELHPTDAQAGRILGREFSTLQLLQALVNRVAAARAAGKVDVVVVTEDGRILRGREDKPIAGLAGVEVKAEVVEPEDQP